MSKNFAKRFGAALLLGCGVSALCAPASAQDAGNDSGLGEIVVTAQRAEERLQDVPVAVTAFDAETLETAGISEIEDLGSHVPNVLMREESGVGGLTIAMRGINVSAENFSFDTAVGVYMNEMFVARSNDFTSSFFDVNRVEVLRGPQGTLFGRNTPAGAVLVETRRPGGSFGGYAQVGFGGGGGDIGDGADRTFYRFEGAVDLPASPQFGIRLAGFYENDDGWARSAATGYENASRDDYALRATGQWNPVSNLEATLVVEHSEFSRGAALAVPVAVAAGTYSYDTLNGGTVVYDTVAANIAAGIDPYETDHELTNERNEGTTSSAVLLVDYDISDNWRIRSITGWRDTDRSSYYESDGTAFPSSLTPSILEQSQISQELVLSGDLSETLHFLGGAYYFEETGVDQNTILYNVSAGPPAFTNPLVLRGEDFENSSQAVFANLSLDVSPEITVSGGVRYTEEEKSVVVNSYFATTLTPLAQGPESFSDEVTLYDVRVEWQPREDLLLYAKYGTGYRAGGIGFRAADAQFQPETVDSIEFGMKSDFNIGSAPARLNVALFHSVYQDFQVPVVLTGPTRQTVINAGEATINGLELEFTVRPTRNLELTASAGLLDAGYDQFIFNNVSLGGLVDLTDNELRGASDENYNVGVLYTLPSDIGEWLFRADYSWRSEFETDSVYQSGAPGAAQTTAFHQDAFGLLNARVRLADAFGSNMDVSLWGANLTDETYIQYSLFSRPTYTAVFGEPRSIGVELAAHF